MSYIYPMQVKNETKYKVYYIYLHTKIYLGTYSSIQEAKTILSEAEAIMTLSPGLPQFEQYTLNYKKIVCLCNLRDHHSYIKNPIYVFPTYFNYYLSKDLILTFDNKHLFYFSTYKIYKRNNYLYTQDSISQQNILSRFGIQNHSVIGKDYYFKNNNPYDFRHDNLVIINAYRGVTKKDQEHGTVYITSIFTDKNIVVGHYESEIIAAIAYNKAIDLLMQQGSQKDYIPNTLPYLTKDEYKRIYDTIILSPRLQEPENKRKRITSQKRYRGICKYRNSYKVHIGYKGKQLYLGMYPTEKRAAQAYNFASLYLFGRNGYLNDVTPIIHDADTNKIANYFTKYQLLKGASPN